MLIPLQRKKMLEVFMSDPADEIHLREISRLSKVSLNNVNDTMQQFVKDGLFKRREISNMSLFKPNLDSEDLTFCKKDIAFLSLRYTLVIEDYIRRWPEEWFWLHNRWKNGGDERVLDLDKKDTIQ